MSGTTNSTLTITSVSDGNAGNYSVVVSNSAGGVTSSGATLTVIDPPTITSQPLSRTNIAGTTATFTVTSGGTSPNYQWFKDSSPISGAILPTLTLTNVQDADAAAYMVVLTNSAGNVTSAPPATLTVIDPPTITSQPLSQQPLLGSSVSFTVSLNGTPPFKYQWRFNGVAILDGTNAIYMISSVATNNNGNYSVAVTNVAGGVTSSNAVLKVIVPPKLALQFFGVYPLLGLNGMVSSNFNVQYITNLTSTNWINLLYIPNLSFNPYQFIDPAGSGDKPARYYRAVMQ